MTTAPKNPEMDPTPTAKRAQAMRESRQRDSRIKRDRVTTALTSMLTAGEPISFTSVARRAGVSTWLTYATGVREQIEIAIAEQTGDDTQPTATESVLAVRTDLELARQEIRRLRNERDDLRKHLQDALGRQLTNLSTAPLVERIATLSQELTQTRQTNHELTKEIDGLQNDLDGARRALRQMIKNTAVDSTQSVQT